MPDAIWDTDQKYKDNAYRWRERRWREQTKGQKTLVWQIKLKYDTKKWQKHREFDYEEVKTES